MPMQPALAAMQLLWLLPQGTRLLKIGPSVLWVPSMSDSLIGILFSPGKCS